MEGLFTEDLIVQVVYVAGLVIVSVLAYYVKKGIDVATEYLNARIGSDRIIALKDYVSTVVRSIEQSPVFSQWGGEEKKEYAIGVVRTYAERNGLDISYEKVDMFIEEAVQIMKSQLNEDRE